MCHNMMRPRMCHYICSRSRMCQHICSIVRHAPQHRTYDLSIYLLIYEYIYIYTNNLYLSLSLSICLTCVYTSKTKTSSIYLHLSSQLAIIHPSIYLESIYLSNMCIHTCCGLRSDQNIFQDQNIFYLSICLSVYLSKMCTCI
jgi:hypothetical protein